MRAFLALLMLLGTPLVQANESQPEVYSAVEGDEGGSGDAFQQKPFTESQNWFLGVGLNYFKALGLQGRYATRLSEEGLLPDFSDTFYFEGGLGMTFYGEEQGKRGVTGFHFVATGRWDFLYSPDWTFFANLGVGFNSISSGLTNSSVRGGGFFPAAGVGAMFNFLPKWAARADLSYQYSGIGILHRF